MEKRNQMTYHEFILNYLPPVGKTNIVKTIFSIVLCWVKISHTNTNGTTTQSALAETEVPENLVILMNKISDPAFFEIFSAQINSMAGALLTQINTTKVQTTTESYK